MDVVEDGHLSQSSEVSPEVAEETVGDHHYVRVAQGPSYAIDICQFDKCQVKWREINSIKHLLHP